MRIQVPIYLATLLVTIVASGLWGADPTPTSPSALNVTIDVKPMDTGVPWEMRFSPSGEYLWNPGMGNHNLIAWKTGKVIQPGAGTHALQLSPDAKYMAVTNEGFHDQRLHWYGISLLDATTGKIVTTTEIEDIAIRMLAFTPDSKRLFAVSYDALYELEVPSGKLVQTTKPFVEPRDLAIAPDGKTYAVLRMVFPESKDADIKPSVVPVQISLYRMGTRQLIVAFDPVLTKVDSFAFTPDGKYLVTNASPAPLVYDMDAKKRIALDPSEYFPRPFLPIGGRYLVGFNPHTNANISWDLQTGKLVPLKLLGNGESGPCSIVGVAPDGAHAVMNYGDHIFRADISVAATKP